MEHMPTGIICKKDGQTISTNSYILMFFDHCYPGTTSHIPNPVIIVLVHQTSETGPQNPGPGPRVAAPMLHTPRHRAIWARTACCKTTCTPSLHAPVAGPQETRADLRPDLPTYQPTGTAACMTQENSQPELACWHKCEDAAQVQVHIVSLL